MNAPQPPSAQVSLHADSFAFTTRAARANGVPARLLRSAALHTPTPGVRLDGDPSALEARCQAIALKAPAGSAFSHVTALRLLGIEVPWQLERDDRVHVLAPERDARLRRAGVARHFTAHPIHVRLVNGLRVVAPEQTWVQLAHRLPPDDLVVLGDAMLRRTGPATTLVALRDLAERTHKTRGVVRAREQLDRLRPGTDSSMETRARLIIVGAGLPEPSVNRPAHGPDGAFLALPDLSYPRWRIAIEYDGDVHRTDPATWRRDVERRERLLDAGWTVITVTADHVLRTPELLVARVRRAVGRARQAGAAADPATRDR